MASAIWFLTFVLHSDIMKVYTLTGDKGTTALVGGQRVDKDCTRVEAYGTVDELNAQTSCSTSGRIWQPTAPPSRPFTVLPKPMWNCSKPKSTKWRLHSVGSFCRAVAWWARRAMCAAPWRAVPNAGWWHWQKRRLFRPLWCNISTVWATSSSFLQDLTI